MFTCHKCLTYQTNRRYNLYRHRETCDGSGPSTRQASLKCSKCDTTIGRIDNLRRHQKSCKDKRSVLTQNEHQTENHFPDIINMNEHGTVTLADSAFARSLSVYNLHPMRHTINVQEFAEQMFDLVEATIDNLPNPNSRIRARLIAVVNFSHEFEDEEMTFYFSSLPADIVYDVHEWYWRHISTILNRIESFNQRGSHWVINKIERMELRVANLPDFVGMSRNFKLPKKLYRSKLINIKNCPQGQCFKYAVLSHLHYDEVIKEEREDAATYKRWENEIQWDAWPMRVRDINKFEKAHNLKINVHVFSNGNLQGIVYNNIKMIAPKTVNLLLIEDESSFHYCTITSLSALYYGVNKRHSRFYCERCCQKFKVKTSLEEHYQFCADGKAQIERMPTHPKYQFSNV